jgi:hypothetical protein
MVSNALFCLQYVEAPTVSGAERQSLEGDLLALGEEIEEAWWAYRKTKALGDKQTYDRLVAEHDRLKAQIVELGQSNTEVLVTLEEAALSSAKGEGMLSVVRRVARSITINHSMDEATLTSISGRVSTCESLTAHSNRHHPNY